MKADFPLLPIAALLSTYLLLKQLIKKKKVTFIFLYMNFLRILRLWDLLCQQGGS